MGWGGRLDKGGVVDDKGFNVGFVVYWGVFVGLVHGGLVGEREWEIYINVIKSKIIVKVILFIIILCYDIT